MDKLNEGMKGKCKQDPDSNLSPLHFVSSDATLHHLIPKIVRKFPVNDRDRYGCTPLLLALQKGCSLKTLQVFLDANADIMLTDHEKNNALQSAILGRCSVSVIDCLLKKNIDLVNAENGTGCTPLQTAIKFKCSANILNTLLKAGANVNPQKIVGKNVLHYAIENRYQLYVIKCLLASDKGLLEERDCTGKTPLLLALSLSCDYQLFKYLMDNGADTNAVDNEENTALHCATQASCSTDILQRIIWKNKELISLKNLNGCIPLFYARQFWVASTLIDAGSRVDAKDPWLFPLQYLLINRSPTSSTVKLFLEHMDQADLNTVTESGNTFLDLAVAAKCSSDVICTLRDAGIKTLKSDRLNDYAFDTSPQNAQITDTHAKFLHDNDILKARIVKLENLFLEFLECSSLRDPNFVRECFKMFPYYPSKLYIQGPISELEILKSSTDFFTGFDSLKDTYHAPHMKTIIPSDLRNSVISSSERVAVFKKEVDDIKRMLKACSSLYTRRLCFILDTDEKEACFAADLTHRILDYLNVEELEVLVLAFPYED